MELLKTLVKRGHISLNNDGYESDIENLEGEIEVLDNDDEIGEVLTTLDQLRKEGQKLTEVLERGEKSEKGITQEEFDHFLENSNEDESFFVKIEEEKVVS